MDKLYTTGDLAKRFDRSREMIHRYVKTGKLKPSLVTTNNVLLFNESSITDFEINHLNKLKKGKSNV